jgi:glycosyltransferase involved in cell wall biosynthesis
MMTASSNLFPKGFKIKNEPLNILFVADVSIRHVPGGAERVLREQAVRLARMGHAVHVLTRRLASHTSDYEIIDGVREWRYAVDPANSAAILLSSVVNCRKLFAKMVHEVSFGLINFHQPFSAFAVNLSRESEKIPKVYTCHSFSFEEYQTREVQKKRGLRAPVTRLNSRLRKWIEKYSLDKSGKVIVLSRFTFDKLVDTHHIPARKIVIIPGAADVQKFCPAADRAEIHRQLNIPADAFLLFTARNLVARMGLDNLLRAMVLVRPTIKNCYLVISGSGELKEQLRSLIQDLHLTDCVRLTGFLPDEDVLKYYQSADFFVLPTVSLEGFGLVTIEAMACGTPALGTPIGGTKEILDRFDPSFLFKDTSPEAIAELIIEKYNYYQPRPDEYRQLREKCRTFVVDHFSWDINLKTIEREFRQCAASAEN